MYIVALLLVLSALSGGCYDRETRRIQPHWLRTTENYLLRIEQIHQAGKSVKITERDVIDTSFEDRGVVGTLGAQQYGFWLELTNKSGKPFRLLWSAARYVDEAGTEHAVYAQPRGSLPDDRQNLKVPPPQPVRPAEEVRPTVVPIYKQVMLGGDRGELYPYSEPLIPTKLDDKNEQQMKAYVDDLAKRQVPVKLFLPIEIDGMRYDYTFSFVLKERWSNPQKQ